MAEALDRLTRRYGKGAVILSTRTLTKGGLFGIGGKPYVEITAARTLFDLPLSMRRGTVLHRSKPGERAEGAAAPMTLPRKRAASPPADALLTEVGSLKSLVTDLLQETRRSKLAIEPGELYETYRRLVENEVAEDVACKLIDGVRRSLTPEQLRDPHAVRTKLAALLEPMLPTSGPIQMTEKGRPTIVALIGPTGVGKTTTVAKLAANLCLREHRKVGLITIDTYRIAAVEQLRTYAQIIDIPLEVAMSPDQLKESVARLADRDVILIDTAGRSQRDGKKINELRAFFEVVRPQEIHLVLSSTSHEKVLSETIERFSDLGVDRVIFTKLDEALGFGVLLTCLRKVNAKLSYVTTGQDVPSDIAVGEGSALAELILGARPLRPEATASVAP